jgi:hypothetical protein
VAHVEGGEPKLNKARATGPLHFNGEQPMVKPNYAFAKRQRELAKKQKKEAKQREKDAAKAPAEGANPDAPEAPAEPQPDAQS